jgi:endonuclease YncB( thermonuclease family)
MKRLIIILSLLLPCAVQADLTGRVVGVADGDTITVLDAANRQTKVRLHQIDAPEKKQDFGQASKQSLSALVFGKQVRIEVADTDKYGRTVGKVWVNGQDANLEQVKRGMAWVYEKYAQEPAYFAAERTARMNRVGLWNQPNPMPPWDFRHGGKTTSNKAFNRSTSPSAKASTSSRRCGYKRFCKEMSSCEEARYYLNTCGVKQLDGDGDGRPCESLCAR